MDDLFVVQHMPASSLPGLLNGKRTSPEAMQLAKSSAGYGLDTGQDLVCHLVGLEVDGFLIIVAFLIDLP